MNTTQIANSFVPSHLPLECLVARHTEACHVISLASYCSQFYLHVLQCVRVCESYIYTDVLFAEIHMEEGGC